MSGRRDHAVILARGASRRMGRPKGLCEAPSGEGTLLQAVAALYAEFGLPLLVVTTAELGGLYRPLLSAQPRVAWAFAPAGGDTAATVAAALTALGEAATHLWLHPVDLPGVSRRTLDRLAAVSRGAPSAVVTPEHDGVPGHPVVLPAAPFADLRGTAPAGRMRDLLAARARGEGGLRIAMIAVAVPDAGVIADLDAPAAGDGPGARQQEDEP